MQFAPATRDHPVTIRSARPEDAPDVERLYRQLVPNDPAVRVLPGRIDQVAADPASLLLVAERSDRVAGSAFVTVCLDTMYGDRPYLVIENVVVEATARGAGVGRRLLEAVDRVAVEAGASKVMLLSSAARTEAHWFFEACGYAADAKRGFVRYRSAMQG